jgi:hypothetical protein
VIGQGVPDGGSQDMRLNPTSTLWEEVPTTGHPPVRRASQGGVTFGRRSDHEAVNSSA